MTNFDEVSGTLRELYGEQKFSEILEIALAHRDSFTGNERSEMIYWANIVTQVIEVEGIGHDFGKAYSDKLREAATFITEKVDLTS